MFVTDVFVEWLVKRRKSGLDWAMILGSLVLSVVLLLVSFHVAVLVNFPMIPYFLFFGCAYGVYWIISQLNLEFEYSFTNGDITVDKIINKKKRKRVVSFDAKNVEAIGEVKDASTLAKLGNVNNIHRAGENANGVAIVCL